MTDGFGHDPDLPAGLPNPAGTIGSSLDHLIGTWTIAEADELDTVLKDFRAVDEYA